MKIGFMGTKFRMERLKEVLEEHFPEMEKIIRIEESHTYQESVVEELQKMATMVDGIIFGGRLQYELYQNYLEGLPIFMKLKLCG